jgi:hypothetical protein
MQSSRADDVTDNARRSLWCEYLCVLLLDACVYDLQCKHLPDVHILLTEFLVGISYSSNGARRRNWTLLVRRKDGPRLGTWRKHRQQRTVVSLETGHARGCMNA